MNYENLGRNAFEDKKLQEDEQVFLLSEKIEQLEAQIKQLKKENQELKERIKNDSIHDYLTGIKNRKYFEERAKEIISSLEDTKTEERKEGYKHFSVIFIDIDNFKKINDSLGHNIGDDVLKKVSKIMESNIRDSDIIARWGGEEFVIGLPGSDEKEAFSVAEKIRKAVESAGDSPKITLSMGVANCEENNDIHSLVNNGDKAMYQAKSTGKNKTIRYSEVLENFTKEE